MAVVLGASACGSTDVAATPGETVNTSNGDSGSGGVDENGGAGGNATPDCGRFMVSFAVDGASDTACGRAVLQHGVVFSCEAVDNVGGSSFDISMGIPRTVGTYAHPVATEPVSADEQVANYFAKVTIVDAMGVTYQFDEGHGTGTMSVESASDESVTGTFDFSDSGKRVTGRMTVR